MVTRRPLEASGGLSATPALPIPTPRVRALTTHAQQRHGRGAGEPPRAAAPSLLSAGAAAAPAIGPTGLAAPHGPRSAGSVLLLPRTRSNSHRLRRFPITVSTSQQAGYWARQHGAIAGRKERLGLPPSTPPGIRASAWTEATRGAPPPSQSTHAQSTDPAPCLLPEHVGGGVSLCFSYRQE